MGGPQTGGAPVGPAGPGGARDRAGRAVQGVGLVLMPAGLLWGMTRDDGLGVEILLAGVGFLLVLTGRSMRA